MTEVELETLERLDARTVWVNEERDFTPWLQSNIDRLAQALGIDIDPEVRREIAVGLYSADLLGTDTGSQAGILIENQLERTDHSHLGQLLTYASGLGAKVLVWISPEVPEEHRQALTWLNENTLEDIAFFGVEIELFRIGDSKPAPHFKIVSSPNEWQKGQANRVAKRATPEVSEVKERYAAFWGTVIAAIKTRDPSFTWSKPESGPRQNWMAFSAGRTGFLDQLTFSWDNREEIPRQARALLYIDTGDKLVNEAAFDELALSRDEIEAEFGEPLTWSRRDDIRACHIYTAKPGSIDDPPEILAEHRDWFVERAFRMRRVFAPRLKAMILESREEPEAGLEALGDGSVHT